MAVYGEIDYDGRVQRAAEALSEHYSVSLVSIDSGRGYSNPRFRSHAVRLRSFGALKGLRHLQFWCYLWAVVLRERPWLVYAHDYFLTFPGWVAARLARATLHYDAHELIIPDGEQGVSRRERFFYAMERWVAPRAESVSAANAERARFMAEHYRLAATPLVVRNLPAEASPCDPNDAEKRYPAIRRSSPRSLRLVFQGDMSLERGIGSFVTAMERLDSRFELLLVGSGPDLAKLQEQAAGSGLGDRVVFLGRVPRDDLQSILRTCDIGIVTYSMIGLNNVYCAPNKLYEYAQAGLPVVVTPQPSLARPVLEYGLGAVVPMGSSRAAVDPDAAVAAVLDVVERRETLRDNVVRFSSAHRWEHEEENLRNAVRELERG